MLKRYFDYLRDNPQGYWFKRKLFGWGWTPVTWQGWLITLGFIAFLVWSGLDLAAGREPTSAELFWFFIRIVVSTAIIFVIAYQTGEKPGWQWGFPKEKSGEDQTGTGAPPVDK